VISWLWYLESVLSNTFTTHKTSETSHHLWKNQLWHFHFELERQTFSEQLPLGLKLRRTLQLAEQFVFSDLFLVVSAEEVVEVGLFFWCTCLNWRVVGVVGLRVFYFCCLGV
jgi:hypothetical protein